MGSIAPIDEKAISHAARMTGRLVVAEEHVTHGGLFGAVAEAAAQMKPVPIFPIGIPNEFVPIGPSNFLFERHGLEAEQMANQIIRWLEKGLVESRAPAK